MSSNEIPKIQYSVGAFEIEHNKLQLTTRREVNNAVEVISRQVLDLSEKVIHEALVKKGWSAPGSHHKEKERDD